MAKSFFESSYKRAKRVEDLPWYRDYTPRFLNEALQRLSAKMATRDFTSSTA